MVKAGNPKEKHDQAWKVIEELKENIEELRENIEESNAKIVRKNNFREERRIKVQLDQAIRDDSGEKHTTSEAGWDNTDKLFTEINTQLEELLKILISCESKPQYKDIFYTDTQDSRTSTELGNKLKTLLRKLVAFTFPRVKSSSIIHQQKRLRNMYIYEILCIIVPAGFGEFMRSLNNYERNQEKEKNIFWKYSVDLSLARHPFDPLKLTILGTTKFLGALGYYTVGKAYHEYYRDDKTSYAELVELTNEVKNMIYEKSEKYEQEMTDFRARMHNAGMYD